MYSNPNSSPLTIPPLSRPPSSVQFNPSPVGPYAIGTQEFNSMNSGYRNPLDDLVSSTNYYINNPPAPRTPQQNVSRKPNGFDQFTSAIDQGANYLSQGIGALAKPISSLVGSAMKPVGAVVETALSPVAGILEGIASTGLGSFGQGFADGYASYQGAAPVPQLPQAPGVPGQVPPQMSFDGLSLEQLEEMLAQIQALMIQAGVNRQ